jgi:hypothetical protein
VNYTQNTKDLLLAAEKWVRDELSTTAIAEAEEVITQMSRKLSEHMMTAFAEKLILSLLTKGCVSNANVAARQYSRATASVGFAPSAVTLDPVELIIIVHSVIAV